MREQDARVGLAVLWFMEWGGWGILVRFVLFRYKRCDEVIETIVGVKQ